MNKVVKTRVIRKKLKKEGWYLVNTVGDHEHYKHPNKEVKVTILKANDEMFGTMLKKLERNTGINF